MEAWKKSNEELLEIMFIQININLKLYHRLIQQIKNDDFSNLVLKLKMQMDLFIKELESIFILDNSKILDQNASSIDKDVDKLLFENPENELFFRIIGEREQYLMKLYDDLLLNAPKDEIAKMIIRNHLKEIRRDISSVKDLNDKIKLLKAS